MRQATKDGITLLAMVLAGVNVLVWCLNHVRHRQAEAPCSEFRDGTVGAMPVRCLPWDVR